MTDPWYPPAEEYFVPKEEDDEYLVRQGDIFGLSPNPENPWLGCMVVHPSCEIQAGKSTLVQVSRIHAVSELADDFQKTSVTFGLSERDGNVRIAFANTFWLPPAAGSGPFSEPMYVDFREISLATSENLHQAKRVRALSHEARLYLIRRKIYFRYRWNLELADVRRTEAQRIGGDPTFRGPKPPWATE